jgi:hypothetical protein
MANSRMLWVVRIVDIARLMTVRARGCAAIGSAVG